MPKVLNKRLDEIPSNAVYVGRPSKWGNPFEIGSFLAGKTLTRKDCIELYEYYLLHTGAGKRLLEDIDELKDKDLVCWCAPLPCHADILIEIANGRIYKHLEFEDEDDTSLFGSE